MRVHGVPYFPFPERAPRSSTSAVARFSITDVPLRLAPDRMPGEGVVVHRLISEMTTEDGVSGQPEARVLATLRPFEGGEIAGRNVFSITATAARSQRTAWSHIVAASPTLRAAVAAVASIKAPSGTLPEAVVCFRAVLVGRGCLIR